MYFYKKADSQGRIVSILGYPKIIAKILQNKFGTNSFTIARWLKEYVAVTNSQDWWKNIAYSGRNSIYVLVNMYEAIQQGEEYYLSWRKKNDFFTRDYIWDPERELITIEEELWDAMLSSSFFHSALIKEILISNINLQPYKKLNYSDASEKFEKKKVFSDDNVIKDYENGWRWVNVGKRCEFVGREMSNCGSSGLMSDDPDNTILTLFSPDLKPKAMLVWSPNQKRLSGAEGKAQNAIDSQYHDKVIDLARTLDAKYDPRSVSNRDQEIWFYDVSGNKPELISETYLGKIYRIKTPDGKVWLSNGHLFIEELEFNKIKSEIENDIKNENPDLFKDPVPDEDDQAMIFNKTFNHRRVKEKSIGQYYFEKPYRNQTVATILELKNTLNKQGSIIGSELLSKLILDIFKK